MNVHVVTVGPAGFAPWVDASVEVYLGALGRPPEVAPGRRASTREHLDEPGLQAVLAHDGDALVGFAYGYDDLPGQWWHDVVAEAVSARERARWLSAAYQVTELHVLPPYQGRGLGRALLTTLLAGTPRRTAVLSAHDLDSPARRLYAGLGFVDLLRSFRFPGTPERYAVMAADLPLAGTTRQGGPAGGAACDRAAAGGAAGAAAGGGGPA